MTKRNTNKTKRIRKKLKSVAANGKLRISYHSSLKHLYVQVIDDNNSHTVASVSTLKNKDDKYHSNKVNALQLADDLSKKLKKVDAKGYYLDRGNKLYTGVIKEFADKLRQNGINI